MKKQSITTTFFVAATVLLSFFAGYITRDLLSRRISRFPILSEALQILEEHALNPLPDFTTLEYGMIKGMLEEYGDPFTTFVKPPQHELQTDTLQGSFGGIGVRLDRDSNGNVFLFPFQDGPAELAGIKGGDRLISVDGNLIGAATTLEEIQALLRGPVGESASVEVARSPENMILIFDIKRAEIHIPSVTWRQNIEEPEVGILEVNILAETTAEEVQRGVRELQSLGVLYFILDLRGNGGGLLDSGIETARLFLSSGTVIEQQYRGEAVETFSVSQPGPLAALPLVVLVDHGTASAAEIVAGALQANGQAALIGNPTFGKDTIQLVFELRDGSSLHVTAASWWFPDIEFPHDDYGLEPEYIVNKDNGGSDPAMQQAISVLLNRP